MESVTYRVGDLKKIIAESSSEFKAKIGDGVESGNKTNAGKAYSDAKKRAKDFDNGGKEDYWKGTEKYEKEDYNGTTLDYNPENVDEKYKKRVHAQVKGYTSEAEMNNKEEKNADFKDNEDIYQGIKKSGQEMHNKKEELKKTGLQASKMPNGTFKKEEMYESYDGFKMRKMINTINEASNGVSNEFNSPVKTVFFKKTLFLSEEHMFSRIPDEFKNEGYKFRMKDRTNNEYLLEWKGGKANILEHSNKYGMDESMYRMKQLMDYTSSYNETPKSIRLNEDNELNNTINRMRNLFK